MLTEWGVASGAAAIMILFRIAAWHKKDEQLATPDFRESAMASPASPLPTGQDLWADLNNAAVAHMQRVYGQPGWSPQLRHGLRAIFWFWALCMTLCSTDALLSVLGFQWWKPLLFPAWGVGLGTLLLFIALQIYGSWNDYRTQGMAFFWKDRCRQSVERLRQTSPNVVAYLQGIEPIDLPWWWLYDRRTPVWLFRMRAAAIRASAWLIVAVTAFWGWYGVDPNVSHQPYADTAIVASSVIILACGIGLHRNLAIQLAAWTGATNKAYPTFALAVLRMDLSDQ